MCLNPTATPRTAESLLAHGTRRRLSSRHVFLSGAPCHRKTFGVFLPAGRQTDIQPNHGVADEGKSWSRPLDISPMLGKFGGTLAGPSFALSTLRCPFVWMKGVLNGYSSTRVSLLDSLMFGRLAMGFATVRASRYGIR